MSDSADFELSLDSVSEDSEEVTSEDEAYAEDLQVFYELEEKDFEAITTEEVLPEEAQEATIAASIAEIQEVIEPVKAPVGLVRPAQEVEAMQYSSVAEGELFVDWGENAIRFDNPFLTVYTTEGQQICNPGDWVVKSETGFKVVSYIDIAKDYVDQ